MYVSKFFNIMNCLKWTKRFSPTMYEQVNALIEELDLIPSCYVTPTLARAIASEFYEMRAEKALSQIEVEISKELQVNVQKRMHSHFNHRTQYEYLNFGENE